FGGRFFLLAGDGIRDRNVTGVQTCALPICNQNKNSKMKLFTLTGNEPLAREIADHIGIPLGKCTVNRFSDEEVQVNVEESVRGCDVFVIQPTSQPVNENLM